MQPSIVEELITVPGSMSVNADICGFSEEQVTHYTGILEETLNEVACADQDDCKAVITSVCGSGTVRRLQGGTSTWQVDFEISQIFTCQIASCDGDQDTATSSSLAEIISAHVMSSIDGDQFATILSQKIIATPGPLDVNIVTCLVVWGVIEESVTAVANKDGTGRFYPDWDGHSGTCLQDGNEPQYMQKNGTSWIYDTLEGCCTEYYDGWNWNNCLHTFGSGQWFVDYTTGKCGTDCHIGSGSTCIGLANPVANDLFLDPLTCCQAKLQWKFDEFCEADSLGTSCYLGTGKYYRGDNSKELDSNVCVRDCRIGSADPSCGGIIEEEHIKLYETPEDCCTNEFDWIQNELCAKRTTRGSVSKYWPDMTEGKCVDDSISPTEDLSVELYDTRASCCTVIHWVSDAACIADSSSVALEPQGSGKYYIDWRNEKCVADCAEGSGEQDCGGLAEIWDDLHETAADCCDYMPWVDREQCFGAETERDLESSP